MDADKPLITLAGPSASGKSYFAEQLTAGLKAHDKTVLQISSDNYYHNDTQLHALIYGTYDHPNLIQYDQLNHDLHHYLDQGSMELPTYSFVEKRTIGSTHIDKQYDFILVEGIYAIAQVDTTLPEFTIFVTAPAEELLMRRFIRDQDRTQEPRDQIIHKMDNMFPMRNVYGAHQDRADVVVQNTYNILSAQGKKYEIIAPQVAPTWQQKEHIYAIDHIYLDENEGIHDDVIILSENYDASDRKQLRSVDVKNVMKLQRNGKKIIKTIRFRFYQPGIITSLHSLFQLAGLQVSHTSYVNKTYYLDGQQSYIHIDHVHKDEQELFKKLPD